MQRMNRPSTVGPSIHPGKRSYWSTNPAKRWASSGPSKRPCSSDAVVPKAGGIKAYDLPPHYYHIGDGKFVVVSNFRDNVKIHIRNYRMEGDLYYPTKVGITVSASAFQKFSRSLNFAEFSYIEGNDKDCVNVFRQEFLISRRTVDFKSMFLFQRMCETNEGLCKVLFSPTISLNSEEFEHLYDIRDKVMDSAMELLFSGVFLKAVLKEKENAVIIESDVEDSEIILSTLLFETLLTAIKLNIGSLLVCPGCIQNQGNQLAHDCVTLSNEFRDDNYFDQAVADLYFVAVSKDFVKNASVYLKYLSEDFLKSVSLKGLLKTIRDHYVQEYTGFV